MAATVPISGKLPRNTPIKELGLTTAQYSKLTPQARRLTKDDLVGLEKWVQAGGKGKAPDNLTILDLNSLRGAYGTRETALAKAKKQSGGTTYCCCCSPCCCCTAAAEIAPVRHM